jgi:exopolyphosphatase/pppGpp-phosphohydrolase
MRRPDCSIAGHRLTARLRYNSVEMGIPPATTAVIKIGSTSVGLLIADRIAKPLRDESWDLGLLQAADPAAELSRLWPVLEHRLRQHHARRVLVATGEVGRVHAGWSRALGAMADALWVLSGEDEARATWWGVKALFSEPVTVLDVGGGSTEVATAGLAKSWPFGAAAPPPDAPWEFPPEVRGRQVVAVGGTARALAAWCGHPAMTREDLAALLAHPPAPEAVVATLGLSPLRARLMVGGARTMLAALVGLEASSALISSRDLRHGLWLAAALGRGKDVGLA